MLAASSTRPTDALERLAIDAASDKVIETEDDAAGLGVLAKSWMAGCLADRARSQARLPTYPFTRASRGPSDCVRWPQRSPQLGASPIPVPASWNCSGAR
ncbi:hypothetical protein SAZ_42640 [Streptomyces noursei ZPM]|nr:hypothetical protein SAZ_00165 [Streptomyces noursei ZPM]AKA09321.1 hypothetical protein SAZ_42640 [Streptomyces noursei ZPM]EPY92102.1 hypothetical protein K530_55100 [Streptomyces noursei CCRC 11814]EXU92460.1 hypothetical protein P354_21255 [Streptomyces noursei PD-1]